MPDVLISENIPGEEMDRLIASCDAVFAPELWKDPDKLAAMIGEFRGLIVRNQTQVTRELLAAATKLEIIGRAGVGLDNVDVAAASERGMIVRQQPDRAAPAVDDGLTAMLAAGGKYLQRLVHPANDRRVGLS